MLIHANCWSERIVIKIFASLIWQDACGFCEVNIQRLQFVSFYANTVTNIMYCRTYRNWKNFSWIALGKTVTFLKMISLSCSRCRCKGPMKYFHTVWNTWLSQIFTLSTSMCWLHLPESLLSIQLLSPLLLYYFVLEPCDGEILSLDCLRCSVQNGGQSFVSNLGVWLKYGYYLSVAFFL